jgi:hypothetical protein
MALVSRVPQGRVPGEGEGMKHTTESHSRPCNCRSVGECNCNIFAESDAIDILCRDFGLALAAKLHKKRYEGKSGWDDPDWSRADILRQLRDHIDKGDMLGVAAFAMFAWNQEGGTS